MSLSTITYNSFGGVSYTLPVGHQYEVERETGCLDIALVRDVERDCPLQVTILVRTTGEVVLWHTEWSPGTGNTYWHFTAGSDADSAKRPPTEAQRTALELMWLDKLDLPGGLHGTLGQPVAAWAFADTTPDEIAARHGAPRPILNG